MEITNWLRQLHLERYESAFRENDINPAVLPNLTSEDLKDLGVTSVGHRRQLLEAIAALRGDSAQVLAAPTNAASPDGGTAWSAAERRQLSVMFCDVIGSTALSSRLDPEDLSGVIRDYQARVATTIARFGGFIARYVGDGVLTYFGWPEAHEANAERAVRAALAVIEVISQAPVRTERLQVRIGIATGLVVVGEPIGTGDARQQTAIGETPNRAARLQGLAEPNGIVIDAATRRQIGALFDLADLGSQSLAGFAEAQHAWRVLCESGMLNRFEALRSGTTPLIGRSEELDLLLRRWGQAKKGEGRVVLLSGEPGIGKSRLNAAVLERLEDESHTRLRYFCSPHHQDSALHPVIVQIERAAGFTRDDSDATRLEKLQVLLAANTRDDDGIALMTELLSLPSRAADLNLSPQRKREKLFETVLSLLDAEARRRPVLMVFEDAHWIDPTSRELLDLTVDRVRRLPVLLLITFRPEFQPPWGDQAHVTSVALNRLDERDGQSLVQTLAGNVALSTDIVADIVERADGVPLFVEELTKAVLESAAQGDQVAALLTKASQTAVSVPATLHASLMARLDRLGPTVKEVAQIGAVLGREFSYELIELVSQRAADELQVALNMLGRAGLLSWRGTAPHASYLFKHALVQDAAYSMLLRARRQVLHGRVATTLEEHFADLLERQPELLAYHLAEAGETERAVDQWLKAGRHAVARLAYLEAIARLGRGLDLLRSLPESPGRDSREIELQLALGLCLFTIKGGAEAKPPYSRAHELAASCGEPHQRFEALYGVWQSTCVAGDISGARADTERLLQMAEREGDDGLRLQAHHAGWSMWATGDWAKACEHADAGRRLYDLTRHASHRLVYGGHDPGVCAGSYAAQAEWVLGYPDKSLASLADTFALAEQIAHPFTQSVPLITAAVVYLNLREPERALREVEAIEALAAEQRLSLIYSSGTLRGAALLGQGAIEEAIATIRESVAEWTGLGRTLMLPYAFIFLGEGLARHGDLPAARAALREGLKTACATGEHAWDAELHRVAGTVLLAENKLDEGQASLQEAIRIARAQRAKSFELRATANLSRLLGEQGRRAEARDLLAPVYAWFREGFDTADLREAKVLLEELR